MLFAAARDAAHAQIRMMSPSTNDGTIDGEIQPMWGEEVLLRLIDDILYN